MIFIFIRTVFIFSKKIKINDPPWWHLRKKLKKKNFKSYQKQNSKNKFRKNGNKSENSPEENCDMKKKCIHRHKLMRSQLQPNSKRTHKTWFTKQKYEFKGWAYQSKKTKLISELSCKIKLCAHDVYSILIQKC